MTHTAPLPMHVEQAMAKVTRGHMRNSRWALGDWLQAVGWIRVQCDHEFVSVATFVRGELDAYIAEANSYSQKDLGIDMLKVCHETRSRTFVAFTAEYLRYSASLLAKADA